MSSVFIAAQLIFNVVVIAALIVLLRERRAAAGGTLRSLERQAKRAPRSRAGEQPAASPAARQSPREKNPAPTHLDDLLRDAERRELVAERALKARLAQFREKAAG